MASSKEYLEFVLGQLSELEEITYRAMMGEFIIKYRGKIIGGIYDDRLLVKPVKSAIRYMPMVSDGTLWEGQIALYFRWTCLPDCAVPELDADYRRNNRRLS